MILTLLLSLGIWYVAKFSEEYSASFYKVYLNGVLRLSLHFDTEDFDTMFLWQTWY